MEIRILPLDQLKPAPYNPRKRLRPTDAAWKKLECSLREFGLVEPLVWNELTGHVVGGHARLRILKQLKVTEVAVSVVNLSPEREQALNVVLNNREAQGEFDSTRLAELLTRLEDTPEFELTGFDKADLRAMNLEPADFEPMEEATGDVLVSFRVPRGQYEPLAEKLDLLMQEFDLECHVKGM